MTTKLIFSLLNYSISSKVRKTFCELSGTHNFHIITFFNNTLITCTIISHSKKSAHKKSDRPVAAKNKKPMILIAYFYFDGSTFDETISLRC